MFLLLTISILAGLTVLLSATKHSNSANLKDCPDEGLVAVMKNKAGEKFCVIQRPDGAFGEAIANDTSLFHQLVRHTQVGKTLNVVVNAGATSGYILVDFIKPGFEELIVWCLANPVRCGGLK
jgi:hypothetical protein